MLQKNMAIQIFCRQRLLEPGQVEFLVVARAPDGLGNGETLVGVHHQFHGIADCLAHRAQALHILGYMRFPDFYFHTAKAARLVRQRIFNDFGNGNMQPAAFGIVNRHVVAVRLPP